MAVTIKDVAALAGVSPSTVSRTCKNNPSISEETKERVRKAMIELGYEPNFQASNLASQNSRTIGIILPASAKEVYENSFYLEAVQGISHYCNGRQYMTTIVTGQDEAEILDAVRSMSRSGKVDGFIVLYSKKKTLLSITSLTKVFYIFLSEKQHSTPIRRSILTMTICLPAVKQRNTCTSSGTAGSPTLVPTVP